MNKDETTCLLYFAFIATIITIGLAINNVGQTIECLKMVGVCLGAVLLVFIVGAIDGVVNERKNEIYQAQEPERLKQHQARFYCHICGKPSPRQYEYWDQDGDDKGHLFSEFLVVDYNKPTELVQCVRCQKWTCPYGDPPHMENGVCSKCLNNSSAHVSTGQ